MKLSLPKIKLPNLQLKKTPKENISIGLDIGTSYIKTIVLKRDSERIILNDFCIKYISGDVSNIVKQIITECKLPVNRVNIGFSGKSTIVRDLWMPKMNINELRNSLGYELAQYVPFPVEDIYYDSCILEDNPLTRREGQMRVILSVVYKKHFNEHLRWLKDAGLNPEVIEMDATSLFNVFEWKGLDKSTIGLVDIGNSKTAVNIISDAILMFSREIENGTVKIREAAARGLSIDISEAEKLICSKDAKIENWVQDFIDKLGKELWSSLEYFEAHEQRPVEKVYVTGGGSLCLGLVDSMSQILGVPVELWHPLDKIETNLENTRLAGLKEIAPVFTVATGLARRTI